MYDDYQCWAKLGFPIEIAQIKKSNNDYLISLKKKKISPLSLLS